MAYIGEIGKKVTRTVIYKFRSEYTDYKFSYYGTTHFIHVFEDAEGNSIIWKSTNIVEYINGDSLEFVSIGSKVELTGTVKEHNSYKNEEQTVVTRCKFKLVECAKTEDEIRQEKADLQKASLGEHDFIWEMPYRQYKEHYSDCETVIGSYNDHRDSNGVPQGRATIKVIIREGRLKTSGVRGKRFYSFIFNTSDGGRITYYAVSEVNARKQMKKDFPNSDNWELYTIIK